MRYKIETNTTAFPAFRMTENASLEEADLKGVPREFSEKLTHFFKEVFTVEKLAELHDVVRDPIERDKLTQTVKGFQDKSFDDWNENIDRPLFEKAKKDLSRLEHKIKYHHIDFYLQPYSHHLDIVCLELFHKLKELEPELAKRGVKVPSKTYSNITEGASHEAAHYLRYLSVDGSVLGPTVGGRVNRLLEGNPRMGEWETYGVNMKVLLVDGNLELEMLCNVPPGFGIEEQLQIYLAPARPSIGDALLAATEIIRWARPEHPLYKEVSELILEVLEEVFPRDDMSPEANRKMILSSIKGLDSDWYFRVVLYPRLKPVGDILTQRIIKAITQYVPKDFGILGE
jgi:hypothetical protein